MSLPSQNVSRRPPSLSPCGTVQKYVTRLGSLQLIEILVLASSVVEVNQAVYADRARCFTVGYKKNSEGQFDYCLNACPPV